MKKRKGKKGKKNTRKASHHNQGTPHKLETPPQTQPSQPVLLSRVVKFWLNVIYVLASGLLTNIIYASLPPSLRIEHVIQHPFSFTLTLFFAAIVMASFLLGPYVTKYQSKEQPVLFIGKVRDWLVNVGVPVLLPTFSFILLVALISLVTLRPVWCPSYLCPLPQIPVQEGGIQDKNLHLYVQASFGQYYLIPHEPSNYSGDFLPFDTIASSIDASDTAGHVVLQLQSLQSEQFLIITNVNLLLQEVQPLPSPLYVWKHPPQEKYPASVYLATYRGQRGGMSLTAQPEHYLLRVRPLEATPIEIHIQSQEAVSLTFQVQIAYRVESEARVYPHLLTLSKHFQMVFARFSDWTVYIRENKKFIRSE